MMAWWTDRTGRERMLLAAAGALVAALVLYQFVYSPLAAYHRSAEQAYDRAADRLDFMRAAAGEAATLLARAADAPAGANETPRSAATGSARERGITISRLLPGNDGGLTVWVDNVTSRDFHAWIAALDRDYGVIVTKAAVTRNDGADTVRAQVDLARPQGDGR